MEEHTHLVRESSSNLLLNDGAHEPFQIDKGKAPSSEVTTLGPGNMARATPAMVLDEGRSKLKRKAEHEKKESLEEQVSILPLKLLQNNVWKLLLIAKLLWQQDAICVGLDRKIQL